MKKIKKPTPKAKYSKDAKKENDKKTKSCQMFALALLIHQLPKCP